jgi:D-alanyl-D-alanine carboxypeptidase
MMQLNATGCVFTLKLHIMNKLLTGLCCLLSSLTMAQQPQADTFITSFARQHNFNGTILIEQKGKANYEKSFGYANMAFKVRNTNNTRYRIASITKAFTSVLILQLFEEGKIDLDKPFITYLPNYKGPAGALVTTRQLMNMTSGIHNMDAGLTLEGALQHGVPQYQVPHTSQEMLDKYSSDTLDAKPGTAFDYNNADFIILGKIIESVSGKSFDSLLSEKILQPLGMRHTGMMTQEKIIDSLADTYFYRDDLKALTNDLPFYWGNYYAAGGMYSTIHDLAAFANALFGGKLLKQSTLDQFFVSGLNEYGLGVWVYKNYDINGKMYTIIKRPGSIMGAQGMLFHLLETGETILILSNTGTVSLDDFAADIAKHIK